MAKLRRFALVATSLLLFSSVHGADFSLETLGETIRAALLKAAGVPAEGTPVDVSYNKTLGGPDGLGLALNLTGVVHGPNGTLITEKDTTTVGGADNYKKVHDSKTILSPSELSLNGGKNTFLDNKNSSAGYGAGATVKKNSDSHIGGGGFLNNKNSSAGYGAGATVTKNGDFNIGGGGQAKIKDLNVGGGAGIVKGNAASNDTAGSQYYSPYVPPAVPSVP
ncbi:hypothetical protein COCSUDRAFT_46972 [Coccomyxa subellipsoidea C-169]|uniref:Uncharacterized protein n=1 Tax=Coccomyxa subellipsoidea (strain C-169) TaxID=574566 RepID=I0Z2H5_COCSC|nr:hypothetical protein COCSUDRAFT_46972 [Coccomyxa subellipsoidea C-169]EIE24844.1 hypothetical protein COCSUDRAFT_46972 [Coccomyxa subellipsoidea C-169]|eukprot:XP_005649388.1 hypothetical protein COCSUDRAFT_46972 [Coccomyxa subellipsoidea C-169]